MWKVITVKLHKSDPLLQTLVGSVDVLPRWGEYGGLEEQNNITNWETLLQGWRQIHILENNFTYQKTKINCHNTFTSPETNLHFGNLKTPNT